ncbi:sulfur carrier protein ThiS [Proteus mirabilis]|uniref:sulfur carrier protein ThiS n=1 Tax=Proteus mirabilis TaxID=584 RepID=UPI0034D660C2
MRALEAEETGLESPQGIAIALNGRVVRKREWAQTPLREGDRVEIVRAMQGG